MEYKHWIVIYPYVYVTNCNGKYILYNTMNGKYIEGDNKMVNDIITKLTMDNAHWMFPITENNDNIDHFVNDIKEKFIGDRIEVKYIHSAVQSYPIKNIQRDIKRYKGNIDYNTDNNIIRYVHELSIYVNSDCPFKCKSCEKAYKQYLFCHRDNKKLSLNREALLSFLKKEKLPSLYRINIAGGNIWEYDYLAELRAKLLSLENISLYLYTNILNFDPTIINQIAPREYIVILVEVNDESMREKFFVHKKIQYQFFVSNDKSVKDVYSIVETYQLCNYQMKPLYVDHNDEFFRRNVYISRDDVFSKIHSFNDIFRNSTLNCNYFGNLCIMADGLVYSNLGKKPLGSISKDSIDDIVRTELQNSKSWFKLRNNIKSCKVCLFKNFCPPLSNIEKVMKKNDLCLINKKE